MSTGAPPQFGLREPDVEYVEKPCAYALAFDAQGRVLVVITPTGMHLPGGGAEDGETPQQNLHRELLEECGMEVGACAFITSATQFVHAVGEGYFAKRCDYFLVELAAVSVPLEDDHHVQWVQPSEALARLGHGSHRFGLETALSA